MKKAFCLLLLLAGATSLSALRKIECNLIPIEHSEIHPLTPTNSSIEKSNNWSGYVAAQNLNSAEDDTVSFIEGSWVVPELISSNLPRAYSAFWVGIDGFLNSTVEQIGTAHDLHGSVQTNYAWFEMYPHAAFKIDGFAFDKGDLITASVTYIETDSDTGESIFEMTITNVTKDYSYTVPTDFTKSSDALRSSAEWIVEAPTKGRRVLPLADFGIAYLSNCTATIKDTNGDDITGAIDDSSWESGKIVMKDVAIKKAVPTSLTNSGEDFNVTWYHP